MQRTFPTTDIYAITDNNLSLGRSLEHVVSALLRAGIRIVQYREKDKDAGIMLEECRLLRRLTQEASACFIVNDHVDIALLVDADGVHVGQEDLPVAAVRSLVGPKRIIGVSTHGPNQLAQAIAQGADYVGVGPVFATNTKKNVCAPVGLDYVHHAAKHSTIPFVAIGGIKEHNVASVLAAGATCCCLVSELVGADTIEEKVKQVRATMAQAGK